MLTLNFSSALITIDGTNECLGSLWHATGHGTFCPNNGRVEVTQEQAKAHNQALEQALIDGLDNQCAVGQGACFYLTGQRGARRIETFCGAVVAERIEETARLVRFSRNGRRFQGYKRPTMDLIYVKRIA